MAYKLSAPARRFYVEHRQPPIKCLTELGRRTCLPAESMGPRHSPAPAMLDAGLPRPRGLRPNATRSGAFRLSRGSQRVLKSRCIPRSAGAYISRIKRSSGPARAQIRGIPIALRAIAAQKRRSGARTFRPACGGGMPSHAISDSRLGVSDPSSAVEVPDCSGKQIRAPVWRARPCVRAPPAGQSRGRSGA